MPNNECSNLWFGVLRKLYEKLSLTRGQLALASELLAREYFSETKSMSIFDAVMLSLQKLNLSGEVVEHKDTYRVKIPGHECQLRDICPLPFYVAASVRTLTGKKVYAVTRESLVEFQEGYCIFELRVFGED